MYLFISPQSISSTDYNKRHQLTNTTSDFTFILPSELSLSGEWELGLIEVLLPRKLNKEIYIYCSAIEWSVLNSEYKPILRIVQQPVSPSQTHYFKVPYTSLRDITFNVRDSANKKVSLTKIIFILELRRAVKNQ